MAIPAALAAGAIALGGTVAWALSNVNKQTLDVINEITQTSVSACTPTKGQSTMSISDSFFYCPSSGDSGGGVYIVQTNTVTAECYLDSLLDTMSDSMYKLTNEQKTNFGMDINISQAQIKTALKQMTVSICQGADSTVEIDVNNTVIIGCPIVLTQSNNLNTQCQIQVAQQAAISLAVELTNDQDGIWTTVLAVVLVVVVVGAAGGAILLLLKAASGGSKKKKDQQKKDPPPDEPEILPVEDAESAEQKGGAGSSLGRSLLLAALILLILIGVLLLIGWYTTPETTSNQTDRFSMGTWHNHRKVKRYLREHAPFRLTSAGLLDVGYYHRRAQATAAAPPTRVAPRQPKTAPRPTYAPPANLVYGQPPPCGPQYTYDRDFLSESEGSSCDGDLWTSGMMADWPAPPVRHGQTHLTPLC